MSRPNCRRASRTVSRSCCVIVEQRRPPAARRRAPCNRCPWPENRPRSLPPANFKRAGCTRALPAKTRKGDHRRGSPDSAIASDTTVTRGEVGHGATRTVRAVTTRETLRRSLRIPPSCAVSPWVIARLLSSCTHAVPPLLRSRVRALRLGGRRPHSIFWVVRLSPRLRSSASDLRVAASPIVATYRRRTLVLAALLAGVRWQRLGQSSMPSGVGRLPSRRRLSVRRAWPLR